jgi:MFS family permease
VLEGNIFKCYLLKAIQCSWLTIPTTILFYKSNGLDLNDLLLLKAVMSIVVFITELPSGYFADVVGRKASLLLSCIVWSLSLFIFCLGQDIYYFIVGEALLGLALSLLSGADSALVYDTLLSIKKEDQYQKVESNMGVIAGVSEAVGGLIGAYLAGLALIYPYYVQLVLFLASILLVLTLKEPERKERGLTSKNRFLELWLVCEYSLLKDQVLRQIIMVASFMGLGTFIIVWHAQAYMDLIKFEPIYFGYAWALFHLIMALGSRISNYFESKFERNTIYKILTVLLLIGYLGIAIFDNYYGLLFISLCYLVRGIRIPIQRAHIQEHSPSNIRASIMSIHSLVFRVLFVIYSPILGYLATKHSVQIAFLITGIMVAAPCWWYLLAKKAK